MSDGRTITMLLLLLQIADAYPGDVGIAKDPKVLFAESFDGDLKDVGPRWGEISKAEKRLAERT